MKNGFVPPAYSSKSVRRHTPEDGTVNINNAKYEIKP